jgi:Mg-chelatase subunit ChlD
MISSMKILNTILETLGISEEEIRQALTGAPPPQKALSSGTVSTPAGADLNLPSRLPVPTSQVYLLLDISGSMDEEKLTQARRGGTEFAEDAIRRGYRVGVIQFSSWASLKVAPTENRREIERGLTEIGLQASTNMASAIRLATEHLGSDEGERAIVLVTDGFPDSESKALAAAAKAKRQAVTIIAIGTDDADREFLARLASATELSRKVSREELHVAITDAARLLPAKSSR